MPIDLVIGLGVILLVISFIVMKKFKLNLDLKNLRLLILITLILICISLFTENKLNWSFPHRSFSNWQEFKNSEWQPADLNYFYLLGNFIFYLGIISFIATLWRLVKNKKQNLDPLKSS